MALPQTLSDLTIATDLRRMFYGPWKTAGDAFYAAGSDNSAGDDKWNVVKATDPTSSWSDQDSGSQPSMGGTPQAVWCHLDDTGDEFLHLFSGAFGGKFQYSAFKTSDDTYDSGKKEETIATPSPAPQDSHCIISGDVRSDGDVIALYAAAESVSSTDRTRARYARRESGSWTSNISVSPDGSTDFFIPQVTKRGESDKMHFFYTNDTDGDVFHKSLTSGNSLSSAEQVNDTTTKAVDDPVLPACYYDSSGVERITVGWKKDSDDKIYTSEIDDDGVPGAEEVASDTTAGTRSDLIIACLAPDNQDAHLLFSDDASQDLFSDKNSDGGGWGTDVEELDAVDIRHISSNVYVRSSVTRLAFVQNNVSSVEYNEIDLAAAARGPFVIFTSSD